MPGPPPPPIPPPPGGPKEPPKEHPRTTKNPEPRLDPVMVVPTAARGIPPPIPAAEPRPYRNAFTAAIGSALFAAIVTGAADVILTLMDAGNVAGRESWRFAAVAVSLYLIAALVLGAAQGLLAGAFAATHPGAGVRSLWRKLGDDAELDRKVAGFMLAGAGSAALFLAAVAGLAMVLVATVERKTVGAILLGAAVVAIVPVFVMITYPIYRLARYAVMAIPRLGPMPATFFLLLLTAGAGLSVGGLFVATRLDWPAVKIKLGPAFAAALFVAAQLLYLTLIRPAARRVAKVAHRRIVFGAVTGLAVLAPVLTLSGDEPNDRVVRLLTIESRGTRALVGGVRLVFDRDGDGYSSLLGGGDCNDGNFRVNRGAPEIPGNGVDDNCVGGDAPAEAAPVAPPKATPAAPKAAAFKWDGNVVVIAVDTVRADRLGAAGYKRRGGKSLTPHIDALVDKGVWFTRAYAQAPNTPRSFPSLFLSRYPSRIAWEPGFLNYPKVLDENQSVFEVLAGAGLHTVGISSHFYFTPERGITQGFVEYDNEGAKSIKDSNTDVAWPRVVPKASAKLKELAAQKKRFVLFAHLFEPHSTYVTHDKYPVAAGGVEGLEEKYDYEIAVADEAVGMIVDSIAAAGLAGSTMIVLLSDHGEAFGAHRFGGERMFFHGQTLYDELLAVPLVFVVPGGQKRKVDAPVMLLDVAPTLLAALDLPIPATFHGRSLLPALTGEPLDPAPVFAELLPAPSWKHEAKMRIDVDGKSKLIYRISDNFYELYDLASDPGEKNDRYRAADATSIRLTEAIAKWMDGLR